MSKDIRKMINEIINFKPIIVENKEGFLEIPKTKKLPEKLYHGTLAIFLNDIKKNGLGSHKNRINVYGDYSSQFNTTKYKDYVFLHEDPYEAISYAENSDYAHDKALEVILLEIPTSSLKLSNLKLDPVLNDPTDEYDEDDYNTKSYIYLGIINGGKIYKASEF